MATWIGLLRGINVGGKNKIKMADLREELTDTGLDNVQTYIQSGNLIFESPDSAKSLEAKIKQRIQQQWGYEVPVMVVRGSDWVALVQNNPFPDVDIATLHVTCLRKKPKPDLIKAIEALDLGDDRFAISGRYAYLVCPNGYSKTKLTNHFLETKLKVEATTRNWKTATKLVEYLK